MVQALVLLEMMVDSYSFTIPTAIKMVGKSPEAELKLSDSAIKDIFSIDGKNNPGLNKSIGLRMNNEIVNLTKREYEVLSILKFHSKNSYIAEKMNISVRTVEDYVSNIKHKLGFYSRQKLVDFAVANNFKNIYRER